MKYFTKTLFIFSLLLTISASAFAASEAEYQKLAKSWTLHADGSQEFRCNMELTLFTHTAMNSTYGESFIVYNPEYQTLTINASYTKQKDGNIVKTPANAFVEVLPAKAADAPAYNRLKEMVVVHTGLELGATIYLDYTITTKAGYLPELDICESIEQSSPVKEYSLTISVPEAKKLNYQLSGLKGEPAIATSDGQQTYTWTLRNVKAMSRLTDIYHLDAPMLAANTYASTQVMAQVLTDQMQTGPNQSVLETLAKDITKDASTDVDKLKAIYGYIQNSYAHIPLDLGVCGYRLRPTEEVIRSAYGTDAERINVFQGLLNATGIKADVCAVFPQTDATGMGLKPVTLYIQTKVNGQEQLLASTAATSRKALLLRQYCPALNLGTGIIEEPQSRQTPISYRADLTLQEDKLSVQAEATVSDFFLDIEGKTAQIIIAGDKAAQIKGADASTSFSYTSTGHIEKAGDYQILSLPDYPFSAVHHTGISESDRDILLTLPAAFDETYMYQVHLGGKTLCTPVTDLKLNNSVGSIEISIHPESDGASVKRTLKLSKSQITPKEYPAYVELMKVWGDQNYTQLIVK